MSKRVVFVLLAALSCFGQTVRQEGPDTGHGSVKTSPARRPATGEFPLIDWPKSAVTVVFAPDLRQAAQSQKSARLETLETWMHNATPAGLTKDVGKPVEFVAPKGAVGIRVGAESAIATAVIIGDDGKRHVECAPLPEAFDRLKSAVSAAHSARVANDK